MIDYENVALSHKIVRIYTQMPIVPSGLKGITDQMVLFLIGDGTQ